MARLGLITTAACFRRSRSLPSLCRNFGLGRHRSCIRPGPCSRSYLCTRVWEGPSQRQPSCAGRRRHGLRCSRRRHARLKTQLGGRRLPAEVLRAALDVLKLPPEDKELIYDLLVSREKLMTTALGDG